VCVSPASPSLPLSWSVFLCLISSPYHIHRQKEILAVNRLRKELARKDMLLQSQGLMQKLLSKVLFLVL
jgi:hypothetical protein